MDETVNPYRAPDSELAVRAEGQKLPMVLAGRWRRFFTYWVDSFVLALVNFAILLVIVAALGVEREEDLSLLLRFALSLAGGLVFFTAFEAAWGRTPGKWVCGTVVVHEDGGRPTTKQALIRSLCRYIPFEVFSIFGDEPVMWHDSLAKTRVVRAPARG